jgi:hypothetical protein
MRRLGCVSAVAVGDLMWAARLVATETLAPNNYVNDLVNEQIPDTNHQTCTLDVKHRFRAGTTATYDGPS